MPNKDQLEIVSPGGEIGFHDLDPGKGVTNIGRHPDNDIVVDGPGIAPFHALLDHRQKPYRVMLLSEEGQARLRGQALSANVFQELHDWDTIELDGYAIVLLEAEPDAAGAEPAPAPQPARAADGTPPPLPAPSLGAGDLGLRPPDRTDEIVVAELSAREWTTDVEQAAVCQVTIVNGGHLVATFVTRVEGLDESWVTISAPQVNLYEGGRTTITISMAPPRLPSSTAGPHHLRVIVSSPNYPGHSTSLGATLHINPYYEFAVADLSPKQQTVSWRRGSGQVTVPVNNKGNSETLFRLEGQDDERGCRFEFEVPGEQVRLVHQAEMRLNADSTYLVPVVVTPIRRRLIALRNRSYSFTITTTMIEGGQLPRSVMGSLKARSLIGPWHILLALVLLFSFIIFFFRPNSEPLLLASTTAPSHGQSVVLQYNASRFTRSSPTSILNNLNALFLKLTLEYRPVAGGWQTLKAPSELDTPIGQATDTPLENGAYRLTVDNWLSQIIPAMKGRSREVSVYVTPIKPEVYFRADREQIMEGESVLLYWRADYAETLLLDHDGIQEPLEEVELIDGRRTFEPVQDTIYTLIASNSSWQDEVRVPVSVRVIHPTATPVPTPVIVRFDVDPLEIMSGDKVKVDWEVEGADSVSIQNLGEGLPPKGQINDQPADSTYYQLTAYKNAPSGPPAENKSLLQEVLVNPQPTATPVPEAPTIELFEATPKEVLVGETVKLTWSVVGTTTNVAITAANVEITGLDNQDVVTVTVKETTLFVLTAYNGDLKSSKAVEVNALEPTATPTLTPVPPTAPPTPTPTFTPTPFPLPVVVYYKAEPLNPGSDKVIFQRIFEGENGTVYVYDVEVGSQVKVSWQVKNAETVLLQGFGTQPSEGSVLLPDPVVAPSTYVLTAANAEGKDVDAFLQLDVTSPSPPQPPFNVRGTEDAVGNKNMLAWSYRDQDRLRIDGFRIYRALVPPGNDFEAVWTEYNPDATTWTDEPGRTCGKAYYVVAVYTDPVTGEELESEASPTSWYTSPCP